MPLSLKRILAFIIDYLIILTYAALLLGATLWLTEPKLMHPLKAQVIGFISLTIPVFLYSYLLERSTYRGTLGKRLMRISVQYKKPVDIAQRNILKYIPWEIGHAGAHWLVYFSLSEMEIPLWNWGLVYFSQLIGLVYFISLFRAKGSKTLYDFLAGTRLVSRNQSQV